MRALALACLALSVPACATGIGDPPEAPAASVRERLAETTRLQVAADASAGAVIAERRMDTGWDPSAIALAIENGELLVSADAGTLTVEGIQVTFAPFALPAGVFQGHDARLTNVRLELAEPTTVAATWQGDDQVTLTADLELALAWQLQLDDGAPTSLGSPQLPPVPLTLTLSGDGAHVDAAVSARAPGEVWSWAGLVRLSEFELDLRAALLAR